MRSKIDKKFVERLSRALHARARQLGYQQKGSRADAPKPDAFCYLADDHGSEPRFGRWAEGVLIFSLKRLHGSIFLKSPSARPCDGIGPFVDDRRRLGVLVGRLTLIDVHEKYDITAHLTVENLQGWNALEPGGSMRWTTGNAELPLNIPDDGRQSLLAAELVAFGPYSQATAQVDYFEPP